MIEKVHYSVEGGFSACNGATRERREKDKRMVTCEKCKRSEAYRSYRYVNLRVGTKVRVVRNPVAPRYSPFFNEDMKEYRRRIVTVASKGGLCGDLDVWIKEDTGIHSWSPRWLVPP